VRNILNPKDTLTNKISFYHLVLFLVALPFDQFYSQVILISFIFHTAFHTRKEDYSRIFRKDVLVLISVFLVTVSCTIYTNNREEAFSLWTRQLSILLFPIVLFANPLPIKKYAKNILLIFAFVCTIAICYLYIDAFRIIKYYHLPASSLFSLSFMNHQFSQPLDIHATYLSMYVFISIIAVIHSSFTANRKSVKIIYIVCSGILLAGLIQLGSRACLISFLVVVCFVIPLLLQGKKRWLFLGFSTLFAIATLVTILSIDGFQKRFLDALREDLSEESIAGSTIDSRMKRWEAAFELVKASPVIGYGTGDEVDLLKKEYFTRKLYNAYINNLNAHNQYISFLLMGGIIALAIYLLTLFFGLQLAIKSKDMVFISFVILLLVVSVSENILMRNKGIFFYSFFFSFFVCAEARIKLKSQKPKHPQSLGNPERALYVLTNKI
jgi:O-antigen ligase